MTDPVNKPDGNEPSNNEPQTQLTPEQMAEKLAEERLAPIKQKLDAAYAKLEEANKKADAAEAARKELEIKRLQDEGKVAEALQRQLDDEKARREQLEAQNVQLSRDTQVRAAIQELGIQFVSGNASEMAYKEIVSRLVRNDQGQWVSTTGASIRDTVSGLAGDENFAFLLKAKTNSGAGTSGNNGTPTPAKPSGSLFKLSQDEVLKMAMEGKLGPVGAVL